MRRWSILGHRRPAAAVHGPPSLLPATVSVYGCEFSVRGAAPEREGGRECAHAQHIIPSATVVELDKRLSIHSEMTLRAGLFEVLD